MFKLFSLVLTASCILFSEVNCEKSTISQLLSKTAETVTSTDPNDSGTDHGNLGRCDKDPNDVWAFNHTINKYNSMVEVGDTFSCTGYDTTLSKEEIQYNCKKTAINAW